MLIRCSLFMFVSWLAIVANSIESETKAILTVPGYLRSPIVIGGGNVGGGNGGGTGVIDDGIGTKWVHRPYQSMVPGQPVESNVFFQPSGVTPVQATSPFQNQQMVFVVPGQPSYGVPSQAFQSPSSSSSTQQQQQQQQPQLQYYQQPQYGYSVPRRQFVQLVPYDGYSQPQVFEVLAIGAPVYMRNPIRSVFNQRVPSSSAMFNSSSEDVKDDGSTKVQPSSQVVSETTNSTSTSSPPTLNSTSSSDTVQTNDHVETDKTVSITKL
ncbi:hypothetical protein RDWZM_002932 [Blomia tropicalis]|uniref:Uncharacterized protein n=1 Tax=Blomia tropicalis TaxID=40697 RepID=A0A9Q0MH75_BLOTA|nr:hypothetical protein RDWZM_002932 [Blomia tropicalis]